MKITDIQRGQFWRRPDARIGEPAVRVMTVCDGYVMYRVPGRMVNVKRHNDFRRDYKLIEHEYAR